jgi:aryl-alcohol dehydrogenase-like predicted oxidoreductase
VPALSFGTGSLHHLVDVQARVNLLVDAVELGMTHLDTAPSYGGGLTESWIGKALGGRWRDVTVATKVGLYPPGGRSHSFVGVLARKAAGRIIPALSRAKVDWSLRSAEASLRGSLTCLGRSHVDLLLLHEPSASVEVADEFAEWFERLRQAGTIRYWGIAGEPESCMPLVLSAHPVAAVVQTRDSLERREASALARANRELQFTYGYLSRSAPTSAGRELRDLIREALRVNRTGSILVSTRRIDHLRALVEAAE